MTDGARYEIEYRAARAQFGLAARKAGARVERHENPAVRGPFGEALITDVAWLGPEDAARVFVCTSGMHGLEGSAGSAAQCAWLAAESTLPAGVAVCLVHALNAWGFAHIARCTENNVDLNRNFMDFGRALPENPFYRHIRDVIRLDEIGPATLGHLMVENTRLTKELGPAALAYAVNAGQYEDAEGLAYGGNGPEFGHRVVRDHVLPKLARASHVGLLDWHTGVGAYGEVAFLPTAGEGTPEWERAARWWGRERVAGWKRSSIEAAIEADEAQSGLTVHKDGQLRFALARMLPSAEVTGAVIEFGTEKEGDYATLVLVTMYERWLRFVACGDRQAHKAHLARALACFAPDDAAWRALVLSEGPKLMDQAIAGIASA
ncbi:MAG: DUF2817 domain-containing protein [Alphaproteobacteria bacterium]|nr:DUF2817 domain-containing protein [Alphaproteobacteria bacterium]